MECYDCGGGIAAGVEKCPSCGCPTEKGKAVLCLRARLLSTEIESASALVRLGWARNAMFTAALLAAASCVIELTNASGNGVRLMVGVVMFILAAGYAAIACTIRRAPLALSVVGLVTGAFFMNGVFWGGDHRRHGDERLVCHSVYERDQTRAGAPHEDQQIEMRCTERFI